MKYVLMKTKMEYHWDRSLDVSFIGIYDTLESAQNASDTREEWYQCDSPYFDFNIGGGSDADGDYWSDSVCFYAGDGDHNNLMWITHPDNDYIIVGIEQESE